jgi:hypothetical protein
LSVPVPSHMEYREQAGIFPVSGIFFETALLIRHYSLSHACYEHKPIVPATRNDPR